MSDRKYYVLCDMNCKFESMTKEQILTAIEQATSTGEINDVDTGFVTKIKESNRNAALSFWVGTQAEYNAISEPVQNCFYIISDDTDGEDFEKLLSELIEKAKTTEGKVYELEKELTKTKEDVTEEINITNTYVNLNTDRITALEGKSGAVIYAHNEKGITDETINTGTLGVEVSEAIEKYTVLWVELGGKYTEISGKGYRTGGGSVMVYKTNDTEVNMRFAGVGFACYTAFSATPYFGRLEIGYNKNSNRITMTSASFSAVGATSTQEFAITAIYGIC